MNQVMYSWQRAVLVGATLGVVSCASLDDKQWYQEAKTTSTKAATVAADATTKAFRRTQHYLEEKDVLKTFQDAGEHSEVAVLEVLHHSGIGQSKSGAAGAGASHGAGSASGTHGAGSSSTTSPLTASRPKSNSSPPSSLPTVYSGALRWPLDGGIVSSEYGPRWGKVHKGLDIAADTGDPVYAIAGGEVIYAGDGLRGYGNVVIVRHDKQMTSLYAHNSELKVHQGDQVSEGTLLALLGSTGHSTGPHVHFEIRQGDSAVDPRGVLPHAAWAEVREKNAERQKIVANNGSASEH
jgi:murein DD-endopeptidase MepM/ murein hydrolase activator NlpD